MTPNWLYRCDQYCRPFITCNDGLVCALCLPLPSLHLSDFYEIFLSVSRFIKECLLVLCLFVSLIVFFGWLFISLSRSVPPGWCVGVTGHSCWLWWPADTLSHSPWASSQCWGWSIRVRLYVCLSSKIMGDMYDTCWLDCCLNLSSVLTNC